MPKNPNNYRLGRRGKPRLNVVGAPLPVKQWRALKKGTPQPVVRYASAGYYASGYVNEE